MTLKFEKENDPSTNKDFTATASYPSKLFSFDGFKGVTYSIFGMSTLTLIRHIPWNFQAMECLFLRIVVHITEQQW